MEVIYIRFCSLFMIQGFYASFNNISMAEC